MRQLLRVRTPRCLWGTRSSLLTRHLSGRSHELERFRYIPLDNKSNEIRLLTVLPSTHTRTDEIQCSLFHTSLDSTSEYHALSYAWRDDSLLPPEQAPTQDGEDVIINNGLLRVGHNLAAALRARRSHTYHSISIWVDAICINQAETEERSGQILRMRNIYSLASKVIVWLGPERLDSEKGIRFIRSIYEKSRSLEGWVKDSSSGAWTNDFKEFSAWFKESLISRRYSADWHALHNLLRRAWWKRIWIVQEMIAAREVEFFCGERTLDPGHLAGFLDLLVAHGVMYLPLLSRIEGIVLEYDTFSLARTYLRQGTWKNVSMLQALYRTGMALSSEPRDKIYAVLNLARDGVIIVPEPDYSLSIEKIYRELVISIVQATGRLDILSLANMPVFPRKLDITLPTWAPDWTYRVTNTINSSIGDVKPVWADNHSYAVANFHSDGTILHAKGFVLDTIDGLAHCIGGSASGISNYKLHQSVSRKSMYTEFEAVEAIWRSLIANLIPSDESARNLFLRQCRNPNHSLPSPGPSKPFIFKNWYKHNQNLIVSGRSIEEWANDLAISGADSNDNFNIKDHDDGPSDLFNYRLPSHWRNRRFLTTSCGFAGLGPNNCMPGDKLCIFLGCCTPIVLREVGNHFEIVGECYVHGIMHGEAMADLDMGGHVTRDFEIW